MKILFQGDSITDTGRNAECGSTISIGQGYAMLIDAFLSKEYPGKYEFINTGISGNRIVDIYQRIKVDFWNLKPDVYSLLIGVNDVWHEFGQHNGVSAERFENVYRMLLNDTLKELPNLKIILLEPFVLKASATAEHWNEFKTEVDKRRAVVRKMADEFNLTFVSLQDKFDKAAQICGADYWLADGVHPTPAGHQLIADEWLKAFKNIVL